MAYFQVLGSMGSQSQDGAFNIPAAFRNFSMSQKEKTLEEFVQDKWLCRTPDGKIGLGVRSFLDLRSWFRTTDIPSCEACNEAVVKVIFYHFFSSLGGHTLSVSKLFVKATDHNI